MGEAAFWSAIRTYTRRFAGKTVRSEDFEKVMVEANRHDLSALFAQWVYDAPVAVAGSSPRP